MTDPIALRRLLDLEGNTEIKVYETAQAAGFHPKAYICYFPDGSGVAYVGSSNLTGPALTRSVEWNYRVLHSVEHAGFQSTQVAFNDLFNQSRSVPLTNDWIDAYERRRKVPESMPPVEVLPEPPPQIPEPHAVQAVPWKHWKKPDVLEHRGACGISDGIG